MKTERERGGGGGERGLKGSAHFALQILVVLSRESQRVKKWSGPLDLGARTLTDELTLELEKNIHPTNSEGPLKIEKRKRETSFARCCRLAAMFTVTASDPSGREVAAA